MLSSIHITKSALTGMLSTTGSMDKLYTQKQSKSQMGLKSFSKHMHDGAGGNVRLKLPDLIRDVTWYFAYVNLMN